MKNLYHSMLQLFEQGNSFVQATILTQSGSAPRTAGAKMLILKDKTILGTIGGGQVEAMVQELAAGLFENKGALIKEYDLTGSKGGQMDMICGGRLEVLIEYMDATNNTLLNVYRNIISTIEQRKKAVLVTPISNYLWENNQSFLVQSDGSFHGSEYSWPDELLESFAGQAKGRYPQVLTFDNQRFLVEPISTYGTVYIFGAGHVSQKLGLLTGLIDFRTVVIDDRREFANRERFATADEVLVVESFGQAFADFKFDPDSYLVIVTRGHAHDKTVLAQALKTNASYIGMIGSVRKRDTLYRSLLSEGFTEQDLKRVYCPIGLEIAAETPEEIAVSIAAELIKIRAGLS
ncbi:XdhC family aldehyde oxidoreductase maturation factor [Desulforamulus aquiferis]|uniref:XdhC/CoxI family protein n=1 Tax=Desulforamulus aquiferis TaxID=1397668 RepID=A0AAW7ZCW9_9FIRM|nr:XdhC/CoxI family protein [Desulforamulus aquiferis]MDO7787538.1 XdhC/CoxI family protein [Desulforamulus aquiferis]